MTPSTQNDELNDQAGLTSRPDEEVAKLERAARKLRWNIVEMVGPNQKGHFGGSLSVVDVIAALSSQRCATTPKILVGGPRSLLIE